MKKVLFAILIVVTANSVIAQGLGFSGAIRAGIAIMFDDGEETRPTMGMSANAGRYANSFALTGNYINVARNVGAKMIFRLDVPDSGDVISSLRYPLVDEASVWVKPFKWLELTAGIMEKFPKGTYETPGGLGDLDLGTGSFASVGTIFTPVDNLTIAIFISPMGGINYSAVSTMQGAEEGTMLNHLSQADYIGSVNYLFPNIVSLHLLGGYRQQSADMGFGFNYIGLYSKGFTSMAADISLENLNNRHDQYGYFQFNTGQRLDYSSGPFMSGIRFVQFMKIGDGIPAGDDGTVHGTALLFHIYARYKIQSSIPVIPGLDLAYINGGVVNQNNNQGFYSLNRNYNTFATGNTVSWAGKNKYDSGLVIDPTVTFEMGTGISFALGYKVSLHLGDPLPPSANGIKTYNMFYLDFNFRF